MLDCIEIDGASNNGVENVRDLIEKARFEPNQWKYKIYIIDEVHMLSTGAFNALLKTLEEPPDHVKFILATTEIDKVPETIKSRSLRFDFKKITETDIFKRLEFVCNEEWIKFEKEALEIIARAARGGLRDALTLTEQNTVNNEINTEYVRSTLSLIEDSLIHEIIEVIVSSDKASMIRILDCLRQQHAEVRNLFDQILYSLRDRMLISFAWKNTDTIGFDTYSQIFSIFESAYSKIKIIPDGWLLIEITLLRAVARDEISPHKEWIKQTIQIHSENDKTNKTEIRDKNALWAISKTNIESCKARSEWVWLSANAFDSTGTEQTASAEKTIPTEWQKEEKTKKEDSEINSEWQKTIEWQAEETTTDSATFSYIHLLEEAKNIRASLVPDLKTARFELSGKTLTLIFAKGWHYNRVNKPDMKNLIAEMLQNIYTGNWNIECQLEWANRSTIADDVF